MNDLIISELDLIEVDSKNELQNIFNPYFEQAEKWKLQAEKIIVTNENEVEKIKEAKNIRLEIKKIRVEVEKKRKDLKEESLRKGKAIDGIANVIKFLIVPIEKHLENQEKFIELQEQKRKQEILEQRQEKLKEFDIDTTFISIGTMSNEDFDNFYLKSKEQFENRKASELLAEKIKEQREKEEKERIEKIEAENKILIEKQKRIEAENKIILDRQLLEQEKLKKELENIKNKEQEIEQEKLRKQLLSFSDHGKFESLFQDLIDLPVYNFDSKKAQDLYNDVKAKIKEITDFIKNNIKEIE